MTCFFRFLSLIELQKVLLLYLLVLSLIRLTLMTLEVFTQRALDIIFLLRLLVSVTSTLINLLLGFITRDECMLLEGKTNFPTIPLLSKALLVNCLLIVSTFLDILFRFWMFLSFVLKPLARRSPMMFFLGFRLFLILQLSIIFAAFLGGSLYFMLEASSPSLDMPSLFG